MNYQEAKEKVFASGTVPKGYFGEREAVDFALMGNTIVTVASCGCFRTGTPDVIDEKEALFVLRRHPSARNIRITRTKGAKQE